MRVIRLSGQPGLDDLTVTREPVPVPGSGEVLMRVHATSLNFHDYIVINRMTQAGRVPMSDGAGVVVALGEGVEDIRVGDRVMGAFFPHWIDGEPTEANNAAVSGETVDGFAAEYVAVPASSLSLIPTGWDFDEAATLPCAGLTAWRAIRVEGKLEAGATVVLPGSGGLSVYMLQLAKTLGISAVSTSSSDAKLDRLASLGAVHGINYRANRRWSTAVREFTNGAGADLVLDIGGQSTLAESVASCRMAGQVVIVGTTGHAAPEIPLGEVVMRHIQITGMAVGSVAQLKDLVRFMEESRLRPIIDKRFSLDQLGDAFRYQLSGHHLGKIVINIQ